MNHKIKLFYDEIGVRAIQIICDTIRENVFKDFCKINIVSYKGGGWRKLLGLPKEG